MVPGKGPIPDAPWPVVKNSPSIAPGPMIGTPSAQTGRNPVQISWMTLFRSAGMTSMADDSSQEMPPAVILASQPAYSRVAPMTMRPSARASM